MDTITEQQIFDRVSAHMMEQWAPAMTPDHACAYRIGSRMCAVGCLIPDEAYSEHLEGFAASDIFGDDDDRITTPMNSEQLNAARHPGLDFLRPHVGLLTHLQNIHDDVVAEDDHIAVGGWPEALRDVARWYKLDTAALEAAIKEHGR